MAIGKTLMPLGMLLGLLGTTSPVAAKSVDELHENLLRAVCLNDWEGAIALVDPLIASPGLSATYRQSMVTLRDQLVALADVGTVIPDIERCEAVLRRYVSAGEIPSEPIAWFAAVERMEMIEDGDLPPRFQSDVPQNGRVVADLERLEMIEISALSPAVFIDMKSGSGVSAGYVSNNEQIHTFFGGLGDRVTVDVDVTRVLPGLFAQNDDTQVFLFDAMGTLIAVNNDADGLQSQLESVLLPRTGRYYVAVTTYDNSPLLDENDRITGWSFNGGSAVDYTLTVRGVTPTAELVLTNYGPE